MVARRTPRALAAMLLLVVLLVVISPAGAAAQAPPVDPDLAAKLQQRLDSWRRNHHAPGVAAAVRLPDGSRWLGTSGRAIRGKQGRNVEVFTPFAVASLTKTFVAATVLLLREEGKLQLGMPMSTWLPKYPEAHRISLQMLLSHRSGIFDYFYHPHYERKVFRRPRHKWTTREILALRGPRYCAPGKCYRYSNTNYVLLAKIITRITGRSVATEIRERFLEPLGLTDTYFQGLEPIRRVPAEGYWWLGRGYTRFADGTRRRPNTSAATVAHGAGALLSSVRDISDWQDALLGGELLSPRSMELMLTFPKSSGYGLGMRVAYLDGRRGIGHGGSLRGFVSIMYRLPQHDLDVVILTNLGRTDIQGLADKLTRVTLNSVAEPEP